MNIEEQFVEKLGQYNYEECKRILSTVSPNEQKNLIEEHLIGTNWIPNNIIDIEIFQNSDADAFLPFLKKLAALLDINLENEIDKGIDIVQIINEHPEMDVQSAIEMAFEEYDEQKDTNIEYQDVVLKSANPEQYPDKIVRCRVIKREDIGNYINGISDEDKCVGCKSEPVEARVGQVGERVLPTLKTTYEGKDYILSEVENEVKETEMEDGTKQPDIIVTNTHSTSNEEYIVRANKFPKMYSANTDGTFTPAPDPRQAAKLSEDVVIETSWGEMAVGLKGSYIVTYDAEKQSYNTIEQGAFESTYTIQDGLNKHL